MIRTEAQRAKQRKYSLKHYYSHVEQRNAQSKAWIASNRERWNAWRREYARLRRIKLNTEKHQKKIESNKTK